MKKLIFIFVFTSLYNCAFSQLKFIPQTGHAGWFEMEIAPDGKRMASGGPEGKLILWDLSSYKAIWQEYGHKSAVTAIEWRFDNRYFLSASLDSTVQIYDTEGMKSVITYHHFYSVTAASFNPKADLVAYGDDHGNILMYHLVKNEEIIRINAGSEITGLKWAANGLVLFASTADHGVMAYSMDTGKKILDMEIKSGCSGFQLTPDNSLLLIHSNDGITELWQATTGKSLGSVESTISSDRNGNQCWVEAAGTYDGKFAVTFDKEKHLKIGHTTEAMTLIYNTQMLQSDIRLIKTSPANNLFVMADVDGGIWICFFNESDFKAERRLFWHKLLYEPERIHQLYFRKNDDILTMKGGFQYDFNFTTGDLSRREDDSTIVENTSTVMRYFSPSKMKDGIYYGVHTTRDLMYKIVGENVFSIPMFAYTEDTSIIGYIDNKQVNFYHLDEARFLLQKKIDDASSTILFNGTLNNRFILQDKKGLHLIDLKTNSTIDLSKSANHQYRWLSSDNNGSFILAADETATLHRWDLPSGNYKKLSGDITQSKIVIFEISPDGKKLVAGELNKTLNVYDLESGKKTNSLNADLPHLMAISISKNGKFIALSDLDGVVHVYSSDLTKNIINIIPSPSNGLLAYTPDHYYIATKEAAQNLAMVNGKNSVGFEQIDLRYNRPDKVLAHIGKADPDLISAYERAWKKRMERNGINNTALNPVVPQLTIRDLQKIPLTTDQDNLNLTVQVKSESELKAVKVWVEGVPVFGKEGVAMSGKSGEKNLNIPLLYGTNKIEIAAIGKDGTESAKEELLLMCKKEQKPELYVLSIGVSKYKDSRFNLQFADKDAKDISSVFSSTSAFAKVHQQTITNEEATREKILAAKKFLLQSKKEDVVVIFVAGHGLRDENLDYYFATYDIDFNHPAERGLSDVEMESMTDGIAALRKLLFFDTCLSGEVDKNEIESELTMNAPSENVQFRNPGVGLRNKNGIGIKNAAFLMKEIFNDVKRGTGATIISSAGGAEFAMESKEWKNGLFTYCLLNGMKNKAADKDKDGEVSLNEIQRYIRKEVTQLSKGKQIPDFRAANMELDFRMW